MTVNWEFFDNQTARVARSTLVDELRAGEPADPHPRRRGCARSSEVSRVLAGFPDGLAGEGPSAGPATLAGLQLCREEMSAGTAQTTTDQAPRRLGGQPTPAATEQDGAT